MEETKLKIVGIDPAPVKGLQVFDGADHQVPLPRARSFLQGLAKQENLLVCWDAPLTGPPEGVLLGREATGSAFSQRPIESFFSRAATGFKTPPGISVRGYSGCPHWAVSRSLLGLPRTGPFDAVDIPFRLAADQARRPESGKHVVEVHPAVALWLWCRSLRAPTGSWDYKKSPEVLQELWGLLMEIPEISDVLSSIQHRPPVSDDELDARVAYALGCLWLDNSASVILLGDSGRGTFLLPNSQSLVAAFASFET